MRICEPRKSYSDLASCSDIETAVPALPRSAITTRLALAAWLTSSRLYWKVKYLRLRRALETLGVEVRVRLPVTVRTVVRVERRVEVERAICLLFSAHCGAVSVEELYHTFLSLSSTFFMFGFFSESGGNDSTSPLNPTPAIHNTGIET